MIHTTTQVLLLLLCSCLQIAKLKFYIGKFSEETIQVEPPNLFNIQEEMEDKVKEIKRWGKVPTENIKTMFIPQN